MRSNILKWSRGVTLVELMVVVALIAIIAAIASPGISRGIDRANARSAAREVASTLRFARDQARSRAVPIWVRVNVADAAGPGSIEILRDSNVPPTRSCRQVAAATLEVVDTLNINEIAGDSSLIGVRPVLAPTTAGINMCFSPDGRVLSPYGSTIPNTAGLCLGETVMLWLARTGENPGNALLNCPADNTARLGLRDQRDAIHLFKVSLPYNGNITVEQ